MKAVVYLPLIACAALLGWYFSSAPQPSATEPAAATYHRPPPGLIELQPAPLRTVEQPSIRLPDSVRGTDVDGQLETDAQGNLLLTGQIRHLFDYFLSTVGEESAAAAQQRIRDYLRDQLPEPALSQALVLLDTYLEYQQQLVELEQHFPVTTSLNDLLAREQTVQRLRAQLFSHEAHQAFFAGDETYNNFTLERLLILQDQGLSEQQKAEAIETLRDSLPEAMQQLLVPQLHQELARETHLLREQNAPMEQVRQLRLQLVGPAATTRLEELDQRRANWQQRLSHYAAEREDILNQPGLADSDRQAAIATLREEQFSPSERLRVDAVLN